MENSKTSDVLNNSAQSSKFKTYLSTVVDNKWSPVVVIAAMLFNFNENQDKVHAAQVKEKEAIIAEKISNAAVLNSYTTWIGTLDQARVTYFRNMCVIWSEKTGLPCKPVPEAPKP